MFWSEHFIFFLWFRPNFQKAGLNPKKDHKDSFTDQREQVKARERLSCRVQTWPASRVAPPPLLYLACTLKRELIPGMRRGNRLEETWGWFLSGCPHHSPRQRRNIISQDTYLSALSHGSSPSLPPIARRNSNSHLRSPITGQTVFSLNTWYRAAFTERWNQLCWWLPARK